MPLSRTRKPSLDPDVAFRDDLDPALVVPPRAFFQPGRVAPGGGHALFFEPVLDVAVPEELLGSGVEALDDRLRRAFWHPHSVPDHGFITGKRFGDGRALGQRIPAPRSR